MSANTEPERSGRAGVDVVEDLGAAIQWRGIGPPRGGRSVAVAGDPVNPGVFYFGSCAGGVWKTTDGGAYWRNVSDGFLRTPAIGALAVAASDPDVLYVGTGEACVRNDVSHGDGVYRSTDAGRTWVHCGLERTRHIARIRVHPQDPAVLYVAALGDIFGPNPERGIYRSTDSGRTWDLVLTRDDRSGAADLWLDPSNPRLLYATLWEAVRRPWAMESGGPGSGLFRSTDGGDTWTELTGRPGLPAGPWGRVGVAGAARRPGRLWALVEAAGGSGLHRSEDGGESWARVSDHKGVTGRPWYYSHLVADPVNPETLWALNETLWRSVDGGATFVRVSTPHGDNHDLWIDPGDTRRMIEGNDGGACVSFNGGETFSTIYNQPTSAFYHLTVDSSFPYRISATQQDNSAIRVPSRSRDGAISWDQCQAVGPSESGYIAVDPLDDEVIYSGGVGSAGGGGAPIVRHDHRTGQERLVTVWPELDSGEDPVSFRHRFNWTFPILFSPDDPKELYVGGERVFRSSDAGQRWEAMSDDLTRADPDKLVASGGPITKDTSGAEVYGTLACLAASRVDASLWAGSDDGRVHVSRDRGATWSDVTPSVLPEWAWITSIEPDPQQPGTAYLTATRYRLQDRTPYLLVTKDHGRSWTLATDGFEQEDFLRIVRADPVRPGLLYAGSESRVYFSRDGGGRWHPLRCNMPPVPIYDLAVVGEELVAATHGRGFWILDGLQVLRSLGDLPELSLFVPAKAYRFPWAGWPERPTAIGPRYFGTAAVVRPPGVGTDPVVIAGGANPPEGATICYLLSEPVEAGKLRLSVLDGGGDEVAVFEGGKLGLDAGFHRVTWDLRAPGVRPLRGADPEEGAQERLGPLVPPGTYRVVLSVAGSELSGELEVLADPRVAVKAKDLARQYKVACQVRDERNRVAGAIDRLRGLRERVGRWTGAEAGAKADAPPGADALPAGEGAADSETAELARSIVDQLGALEERLTRAAITDDTDRLKLPAGLDLKLAALSEMLDGVDAGPTDATVAVLDDLRERAGSAISDLDDLARGPVVELDRKIRASGLPIVSDVASS